MDGWTSYSPGKEFQKQGNVASDQEAGSAPPFFIFFNSFST